MQLTAKPIRLVQLTAIVHVTSFGTEYGAANSDRDLSIVAMFSVISSSVSLSHVLARLANCSLARGDAEVWASRTHVRAC